MPQWFRNGSTGEIMASVTLKNLPEELLVSLRSAAERDRRSLNQEIIHLLDIALRRDESAVHQPTAQAQVAAWRKLAGRWKSDVDPENEARQIVARRTGGRKVDL